MMPRMTPDGERAQPEAGPPTESHRYQLWFEQFRDIAVMAAALAGGAITLFGTVFSTVARRPSSGLTIALFVAAAIVALMGQSAIVDAADRGEPPGLRIRRLRSLGLSLMGAGAGAFLMSAMRAFTS